MIHFSWNATLNRIGSGALAFFVSSAFPSSFDYLSFFGARQAPDRLVLDGVIFIICSYYLGVIFVTLGRGAFWGVEALSWERELLAAARHEKQFFQSTVSGYIEKSDALAGLGAALLSLSTFALASIFSTNWWWLGASILFAFFGFFALKFARLEHAAAARFVSLFEKSLDSETK